MSQTKSCRMSLSTSRGPNVKKLQSETLTLFTKHHLIKSKWSSFKLPNTFLTEQEFLSHIEKKSLNVHWRNISLIVWCKSTSQRRWDDLLIDSQSHHKVCHAVQSPLEAKGCAVCLADIHHMTSWKRRIIYSSKHISNVQMRKVEHTCVSQ